MDNTNELFNDYVEDFKKFSKEDKYNEIIESLKELIASVTLISTLDGIDIPLLQSREVTDLNKETTTDDDYLEAIFVYSEVAKAQLGEYLFYLKSQEQIENMTE